MSRERGTYFGDSGHDMGPALFQGHDGHAAAA